MATKTPLPGRCGARTRSGEFCARAPQKGGARCSSHTGPPPTKGLKSARLRNLGREGQARIASLIDDEDLLDTRRPVAVAEYMLGEALVEMSDKEVLKVAKRLAEIKPRSRQIPDAAYMAEARSILLREPARLLALVSKLQAEAAKQDRQKMAILGLITPLLDSLGHIMQDLAGEYIDDLKRRDEFLASVRVRLRAASGEAVALLDAGDK